MITRSEHLHNAPEKLETLAGCRVEVIVIANPGLSPPISSQVVRLNRADPAIPAKEEESEASEMEP